MKHKSITPNLNTGIASMVVILVILCLTAFAMLTLQTSKNELNSSMKLAEHRQNYYQASNLSEDILRTIADHGYASAEVGTVGPAVNALARESGFDQDVMLTKQGDRFSWKVPIEGDQVLLAEAVFHDNSYTVTKWQVTK